MKMTPDEILAEALKLDPKTRAKVAEKLLESLDPEEEELTSEEWNRLWLEEAHRRLDDLRQGKVKAIPAEEVFARARALLESSKTASSSKPNGGS